MPYGGQDGWKTVFPTAGGKPAAAGGDGTKPARKGRAKKAPKRKPACKYGPRGPDGLCPRKPRATVVGRALAKVGGIRATTRGRQSIATRLARKAEGRVSTVAATLALTKGRALTTAARRAATRLAGPGVKGSIPAAAKAILRSPVSKVASAGAAGFSATLGAVALAGIASFAITTYIINARKKRRMDRAELAAAAADAYRQARADAVAQKGAPLSGLEHQVLAAEFKRQLSDLGLDTANLKGL